MIIDALISVINTVIGWVVSTATMIWGANTYPTGFAEGVGLLKSFDAYIPVTEFLTAVSFIIAYFFSVWGLKWIVKLVDWLPFT